MKSLTILAHHSNYRQIEVGMNTRKKILQIQFDLQSMFQNVGISQCLKIYQKFPFSNFVSKYVKDKLKQDAWLLLPHGSCFSSTLLKVRFEGKMASIWNLEFSN